MSKKISLICLTLAMVLTFSGCQLAKPGRLATRSDQFIGWYITFLNDYTYKDEDEWYRLKASNQKFDAKRQPHTGTGLSGELYEYYTYDFEGLYGGIPFFFINQSPPGSFDSAYTISDAGGAISDQNLSTFLGESSLITMEGTLCATSMHYLDFSQVYLRGDGSVYTISIPHPFIGLADGQGYTYEGPYINIVNNKMIRQTLGLTLYYKIKYPVERFRVIQMCAEDTPITSENYFANALPESVALDAKTAYLIVEILSVSQDANHNQKMSREIFGPGDKYFSIYINRGDGVCIAKQVDLLWGAGQ